MALRFCPHTPVEDEHRLVFPRAALDLARGEAGVQARRSELAAEQEEALGRGVLRTLESMQAGLDRLREDVGSYHFPTIGGPSDGPPLAA